VNVRYVRIKRFAELTGFTVQAVETKIARGVFIEGDHYRRAPDGSVCINLEAYDRWVEGDQAPGLNPLPRRSASASHGRVGAGLKRSA
jgi:hypothetical protein